jgi:hypothetical protein
VIEIQTPDCIPITQSLGLPLFFNNFAAVYLIDPGFLELTNHPLDVMPNTRFKSMPFYHGFQFL